MAVAPGLEELEVAQFEVGAAPIELAPGLVHSVAKHPWTVHSMPILAMSRPQSSIAVDWCKCMIENHRPEQQHGLHLRFVR